MNRWLITVTQAAKCLMGRVKGSFLEVDGIRIHYTVEGNGEPIVLVHGYGVNADFNWRVPGVTDTLARTHKVIAMDVRGHGLSSKPRDPEKYGVEMVKDVVRLLDHLGIDKAHVAGYSMGGFITLKLVTMFPERLLTAIPCAAGWDRPTPQNASLLDGVAEALDAGQGFTPLLEKIEGLGRKPNHVMIFITDRLMRLINDVPALAALMRRFIDLAVNEEELRGNTVPVLSIIGTHDPLRTGVDNMIGVMGNHEAVFVQRGDHTTTMFDPVYIQALTSFLDRHKATAAREGDST